MKAKGISITKFEPGVLNEDAVLARPDCIAVSDGAGGGGVFAERWSLYLVSNLPNQPITTFEALDGWIERIWEPFYNECEQWAKRLKDGMFLKKFYDEGSFATLAALWPYEDRIYWMTYGDSVAFHYNRETKVLEYTFGRLAEFNKPPYLINCKDPLNADGFRAGTFELSHSSLFFVASDTLAHYIIMMYLLEHRDSHHDEIDEAIAAHSKNSVLVKQAAIARKMDFERDVLGKLVNCIGHHTNFKRHLKRLRRQGLIGHDDYSLAVAQL